MLIAAAFLLNLWPLAVGLLFIATIAFNVWNGPTFAIVHGIVEPRMRTTAAAFVFRLMNLVGQGFGPTAIGFLSDRFAGRFMAQAHLRFAAKEAHGAHATMALQDPTAAACHSAPAGIRYPILALSVLLVWSAVHYCVAARICAASRETRRAMRVAVAPSPTCSETIGVTLGCPGGIPTGYHRDFKRRCWPFAGQRLSENLLFAI